MFRIFAPANPVDGLEPRHPRLLHPGTTLDAGVAFVDSDATAAVAVTFAPSGTLVRLDVDRTVRLARQIDRYLLSPGEAGTCMAVEHEGSIYLTSVDHGIVVVDIVGYDGRTERHMTGPLALDALVDELFEVAESLGWTKAAEAA